MPSDEELVRGFEAVTLGEFPHASHVRLTLIYLAGHGEAEARRRLADGLLLFATAKGHPEKFHVTITRAWLELIESARRRHPHSSDPQELIAACPELLDKDAISCFYSPERLASDDARAGWIPPDREPAIDFDVLRSSMKTDRTRRTESV
jgi:hypothetical protein